VRETGSIRARCPWSEHHGSEFPEDVAEVRSKGAGGHYDFNSLRRDPRRMVIQQVVQRAVRPFPSLNLQLHLYCAPMIGEKRRNGGPEGTV
jgi:hypothetical protein